ncbi:zinc finger CCCH domain-containing protein, partial [Trifolium medium]|nr:zinc finger CCCH domain-containing protein [Trifolium medium]
LTPEGDFIFSGSAGAGDNQYELKLELFDKVNVESYGLLPVFNVFP